MRVKSGTVRRQRHKKIINMVSGQWGTRGRLFRRSNEAMMKSYWYAYRDRRVRRRDFRRLWITRVNAGSRANGLPYSKLIYGLKLAGVSLDRKVMADIAVRDEVAFAAIVNIAKEVLAN
jgi:large subunit ribosomal protein L20